MTQAWDFTWLTIATENGNNVDTNTNLDQIIAEAPYYKTAWLAKLIKDNSHQQAHNIVRSHLQNQLLINWITATYNNKAAKSIINTPTVNIKVDKVQVPEAIIEKIESPILPVAKNELEIKVSNIETTTIENGSKAQDLTEKTTPQPAIKLTLEANNTTEEEAASNNTDYVEPIEDEPTTTLTTQSTTAQEPSLFGSKLTDQLKAAAEQLLQKPTEETGKTAFEPFHTVDYFASLGVNLKDLQQADKLNIQVKSFTQWLKAMKKINYQTGEVTIDKEVEAKALASLEKENIVTETMAEVYIKQGRFKEAATVFAKLILAYPEKSTYFATRLEKLKQD